VGLPLEGIEFNTQNCLSLVWLVFVPIGMMLHRVCIDKNICRPYQQMSKKILETESDTCTTERQRKLKKKLLLYSDT
jgi:hypothetical protein